MVNFWLLNLCVLSLAYFLGSLTPGYWAGKWLKGIDIREHGSGSTGATNVLRVVGKWPALVVFSIDVGKGAVAIAATRHLYNSLALCAGSDSTCLSTSFAQADWDLWSPWMVVLAGMAALLGHSKSIFLSLSGGKSVATGLGILLTLDWQVGLATLAVFGVVMAVSRIVSLSSICGAIAVSGLMFWLNPGWPSRLFALVGGIYVIVRHSSNIQRLLNGTEPRLGESAPSEPST